MRGEQSLLLLLVLSCNALSGGKLFSIYNKLQAESKCRRAIC